MGANLDIMVNTKRPASLAAQSANDRITDSVSSWIGPRGLSPLMEKDEEDDVDDKGETLLGQKMTTMKTFPTETFGGPMIGKSHCNTMPHVPQFWNYG